MLGGAFYSTRFYKDLRKNTGLVYYVSAGVQCRARPGYVQRRTYGSDPQNDAKARAIVDRDLHEMATAASARTNCDGEEQILRHSASLGQRRAASRSGYLRG